MEEKRKNVLIISHYFWPEDFKINELAFGLTQKYNVTVLTGKPSYPSKNHFKKPYKTKENKSIKIYRVPIFKRNNSNLSIFLNYLTFLFSLSTFGLFFLRNKNFDFIFVYQPSPITVGIAGIIIKFFKKCKMAIWVNDLWPDNIDHVNLTILKKLKFLFTIITNLIYKNSDYILVQSNGFKKKIKNNCYKKKIFFFPNWIDTTNYKKKKFDSKKIKILRSRNFKIMYIGNIGYSQDFVGIIKILNKVKAKSLNFKFIIIGDGRDKEKIIKEVKNSNLEDYVIFFGRVKKEYIQNFSKFSDVLFLSLRKNKLFEVTIPAKLQTYLSLNKPIFGLISGETSNLISNMKCGITVNSGNYNKASTKIIEIIKNKKILKQFTKHGKISYRQKFLFKNIVKDLDIIINQ